MAIIKDGRLVRTDTVEGLRRSAPSILEMRFHAPVDPGPFESAGARVVARDGASLTLEVPGAIGPVLRVAADLDPVDLVSRHSDLDELFLDFYRSREPEVADEAR